MRLLIIGTGKPSASPFSSFTPPTKKTKKASLKGCQPAAIWVSHSATGSSAASATRCHARRGLDSQLSYLRVNFCAKVMPALLKSASGLSVPVPVIDTPPRPQILRLSKKRACIGENHLPLILHLLFLTRHHRLLGKDDRQCITPALTACYLNAEKNS